MKPSDPVGPSHPRWTGKKFETFKIEGYLIPWSPYTNQPLLVQVGGCPDWFLAIFSTEDKLHAYVDYLYRRGLLRPPVNVEALLSEGVLSIQGQVPPYTIKQVDQGGQGDFLDSLFEAGIRVMADPRIISDKHTKWTEVVWHGDEYKLMSDAQSVVDPPQ